MQSCCDGYLEFGAYEFCPKCASKLWREKDICKFAKDAGVKTFWNMWKVEDENPYGPHAFLEVCRRIENLEKIIANSINLGVEYKEV